MIFCFDSFNLLENISWLGTDFDFEIDRLGSISILRKASIFLKARSKFSRAKRSLENILIEALLNEIGKRSINRSEISTRMLADG